MEQDTQLIATLSRLESKLDQAILRMDTKIDIVIRENAMVSAKNELLERRVSSIEAERGFWHNKIVDLVMKIVIAGTLVIIAGKEFSLKFLGVQ